MLPIPKHLKGVFVPIGEANNEYFVKGAVRCLCGCENFSMSFFANVEKGIPCVCEYKDDYALVVKIECNDCSNEYVIFDMSKHGWNGFVCHDGISVPDDELKLWECPKCANGSHNLEICIGSNGKQDFIDETSIADGETEFSEDEWVEGFESINIKLKCCGCGHSDDNWTYETM